MRAERSTILSPTFHREPGMRLLAILLLTMATTAGYAQAPVDDARQRQDTLQRDQQKAGAAYREMQQAEFAAKRADEDFRQADADYKAAQTRADELKRHADTAKKNLDTGHAKAEQARKSYDAAVDAVERNSQPAQKK
jgi:predicted  nucleic acid-binding Zn-ribbon protein